MTRPTPLNFRVLKEAMTAPEKPEPDRLTTTTTWGPEGGQTTCTGKAPPMPRKDTDADCVWGERPDGTVGRIL